MHLVLREKGIPICNIYCLSSSPPLYPHRSWRQFPCPQAKNSLKVKSLPPILWLPGQLRYGKQSCSSDKAPTEVHIVSPWSVHQEARSSSDYMQISILNQPLIKNKASLHLLITLTNPFFPPLGSTFLSLVWAQL